MERRRKSGEVKDDRTISVEFVKDVIAVARGGTKERYAGQARILFTRLTLPTFSGGPMLGGRLG